MKFELSKRDDPLWVALRERGYTVEESTLEGIPVLRLTSKNGKRWLTSTKIAYPTTSALVHRIAQNKQLTYALAESLGLPIPFTRVVNKNDEVPYDLLETYGQVVVKPLDSYGSRGVTLGIVNRVQLDAALRASFEFSQVALLQQQISGEEYRFTVIDGKVVSVLLRETSRVVGDGVRSVARLIAQENERRRARSLDYITYPQLDGGLIDEVHLTDETVLPKGEIRELNKATMVKDGATVYEVIEETHQDYKAVAERVAEQLASSFTVVDLFLQDHAAAAAEGNYWFNEVNTSPAVRLYYAPVNADDSHVVAKIVDKFDKAISEGL